MKKDTIQLSGGTYTISEFTVGDFIEIEKKFGSLQLDQNKIEPTMFWFWLALKKNHKDTTLEKLYDMVPASFIADGGLAKIFDKLTELNGWDKLPKNEGGPASK